MPCTINILPIDPQQIIAKMLFQQGGKYNTFVTFFFFFIFWDGPRFLLLHIFVYWFCNTLFAIVKKTGRYNYFPTINNQDTAKMIKSDWSLNKMPPQYITDPNNYG